MTTVILSTYFFIFATFMTRSCSDRNMVKNMGNEWKETTTADRLVIPVPVCAKQTIWLVFKGLPGVVRL